jgi:hypothetical protein
MIKLIVRKDALDAIEDKAIYPFIRNQPEAGTINVNGNEMKLYVIELSEDVVDHIISKGIKTENINQLSDFILSSCTAKH